MPAGRRGAPAPFPTGCTAPIATSPTAPLPNLFSFNSPLGACDTCRGFGRVIDMDLDLIIPDPGSPWPRARSSRSGAPGGSLRVPRPARFLPPRAFHGQALRGADPAQQQPSSTARRIITAFAAISSGWRARTYKMHVRVFCRATAATTCVRPATAPLQARNPALSHGRPAHRPNICPQRGPGLDFFEPLTGRGWDEATAWCWTRSWAACATSRTWAWGT
jgi:hypothetical protein